MALDCLCCPAWQEVENAYHSSALLIQMQLVQAQEAGVTISVDTALLENEAQLQRIKACEQAAMARPAADFAIKRAGMKDQHAAGRIKGVDCWVTAAGNAAIGFCSVMCCLPAPKHRGQLLIHHTANRLHGQ